MYIGIAGMPRPAGSPGLEPGAIRPVYHLLLGTLVLDGGGRRTSTAPAPLRYVHQELRKREAAPPLPGKGADPLTWLGRPRLGRLRDGDLGDYATFTVLVELAGATRGTSRALGALLGAITNFTSRSLDLPHQGDSVWRGAPLRGDLAHLAVAQHFRVVLLTDGLRWTPWSPAALVGAVGSVGWNLPPAPLLRFPTERTAPGPAWR